MVYDPYSMSSFPGAPPPGPYRPKQQPGQAHYQGGAQPAPSAANINGRNLEGQGRSASGFAGFGEGNYANMTDEGARFRAGLQRSLDLIDQGKSVAGEQLRQGLQQNVSGQMATAASARPGSAPMAARTAAINAGRAASGLSGQQALAALAERQGVQQMLGQQIMGARGQDLQAALGSRSNAITGYGQASDAALNLHTQDQAADEANKQRQYAAIQAGIMTGAMVASDRRLKTDIVDGRKNADEFIRGLKSYSYSYKDDKHGKGPQLGILAQELEKGPGRQAVVDTPHGKMVDGAKLSGANTAAIARLGERLAALEGKGK
jgi:hypothetical protein